MIEAARSLIDQVQERKRPNEHSKFIILANGSSGFGWGRERKKREMHKAWVVFDAAGVNTDVWSSHEPHEMNDLVKKAAKEADLLVFHSGDGTLWHALQFLYYTKDEALKKPVAILP